ANAFATLTGMAPGRIDFGIGTGFSARRAMGLNAVKLADMEEYIRVVYGLLNHETVETPIEGKRRKIRFLNPEIGLINTKDPIPLHISAYRSRSQALTAKMSAGWKSFVAGRTSHRCRPRSRPKSPAMSRWRAITSRPRSEEH